MPRWGERGTIPSLHTRNGTGRAIAREPDRRCPTMGRACCASDLRPGLERPDTHSTAATSVGHNETQCGPLPVIDVGGSEFTSTGRAAAKLSTHPRGKLSIRARSR